MQAALWVWCLWLVPRMVVPLYAQSMEQSRTINGYVEDAESGERLPGATVSVSELGIGVVTNQYGFYSLRVRHDSLTLAFSYLGYESVRHILSLPVDTTLHVTLVPRVIGLGEIEVIAQSDSLAYPLRLSRHAVSVEQIKTMPVLLGEVDIMKSMQLLPGVQSGAEGKSGMYVRGGGPDQNLVLLDGISVYNAEHLWGLLSSFNAEAMKHVELIKGGFPARYGGRLSSVLNLTMKEGNLKKFSVEGGVGLLSTRILAEGPIIKNKSSFLISGRRTLLDLFTRPFLPKDERFIYYFQDINIKMNYIISPKDRIYVSAWNGHDNINVHELGYYTTKNRNGLKWGNRLAIFRWNHLIGRRTFANLIIGITDYKSELFMKENDTYLNIKKEYFFTSKIMNKTIKMEMEHQFYTAHNIHMGMEYIMHEFMPGTLSEYAKKDNEIIMDTTRMEPMNVKRATELSLYVEDRMIFPGNVHANIGFRLTHYWVQNKRYASLEPRFRMSRRIGKKMIASLSWASTQQYIHLLTPVGSSSFGSVWVPSISDIRPKRAHQIGMGFSQDFLENTYTGSIEGYYIWMHNVLAYEDGAAAFDIVLDRWPDIVEAGNGVSRGVEIFLQKKKGRLQGWTGYTWSRTMRDFQKINGGVTFPYEYDRRHDVSFVVQYRLTDSKEVSASWVYGSGYPIWLPQERYTLFLHGVKQEIVHYGPRNSWRMPPYHRFDFTVHFHKKTGWGYRTFTIGVYNAYNRKNAFLIYPDTLVSPESSVAEVKNKTVVFRKLSVFPVLPILSYTFRF